MSVQTTADDRRDDAKEHITKALNCLQEAVNEDTWGSKDYNSKYLVKIDKAIIRLGKTKREL